MLGRIGAPLAFLLLALLIATGSSAAELRSGGLLDVNFLAGEIDAGNKASPVPMSPLPREAQLPNCAGAGAPEATW